MSPYGLAPLKPNFVNPTKNLRGLLYAPSMTRELSYQTGRSSSKSLAEGAQTMVLRTEELEKGSRREVDEQDQKQSDSEIWDCYDLHEEPSSDPIQDYITHSGVENCIKDDIKTAVEVRPERLITGIVKETVEIGFTKV